MLDRYGWANPPWRPGMTLEQACERASREPAAPRCQFIVAEAQDPARCGLEPWPGAAEAFPVCPAHATRKPPGFRQWLSAAGSEGVRLWSARLSGLWLEGDDLSGICLDRSALQETTLIDVRLTHASLMGVDARSLYGASAMLSKAQMARADFSLAALPGADLTGAGGDAVDLAGADLSEAVLRGADLRRAHIGPCWRNNACNAGVPSEGARCDLTGVRRAATLAGADLRGAALGGAVIDPETDMEDALIGPCPFGPSDNVLYEERVADGTIPYDGRLDSTPTFPDCARTYRQLKLCFQESGDYERAGEFYLGEMRCMTAAAREQRRWLTWLRNKVFWLPAGYGERPSFTAAWAAAVILLWAFFHGWAGFGGDEYAVGPGCTWPSIAAPRAFGRCLYFSAVTFTTLGYGDLHPSTWVGQALAGVEAILGVVLMSLFMVCLVRKFSR